MTAETQTKKTPWYLTERDRRLPEHVDEVEQQFQQLKAAMAQEIRTWRLLGTARVGQASIHMNRATRYSLWIGSGWAGWASASSPCTGR